MSDSHRGGKGPGFEYDSKRPGKGFFSPHGSKLGKRMTHKAERRVGKVKGEPDSHARERTD